MNEAFQASVEQNLAWFKLFEFISRGEKERAFGVYKVLMLAFDSKPFCLLVEGDLHATFDENSEAIQKYLEAAKLYEENQETFLASVAYESVIKISSKAIYWKKLLQLYKEIDYQPKVVRALKNIFLLHLKNKNEPEAKEILLNLKELGNCMEEEESLALYQLQEKTTKKDVLENISKILEEHFTKGNSKGLQKFLSKLETLDKEAYNNAITHMKDKH
jgi:hypothetical protein